MVNILNDCEKKRITPWFFTAQVAKPQRCQVMPYVVNVADLGGRP